MSKANKTLKKYYDAIVIGAGHNGLVAGTYLRRAGLDVLVLEKRGVIGGAAVTEEIIPGFKFSRCSYLLSLLRPIVHQELELKKHGLKLHFRDPSSFTPILGSKRSLLLGPNMEENRRQIAQFSKKDAEAFCKYEEFLGKVVDASDPLFDVAPPNFREGWFRRDNLNSVREMLLSLSRLRGIFPETYELLTAPIAKVLNKHFESEPLKATLCTDGLIGAAQGPYSPGTGYILLHHVMGNLEGKKGAWAYVEGGMGSVSGTIAKVFEMEGGTVSVDSPIDEILLKDGKAVGVRLKCGQEISSKIVLSNATTHNTFTTLLPGSAPQYEDLRKHVDHMDYESPVVKINVALSRIPDFTGDGPKVLPHHRCTIHLNCESIETLNEAYKDYVGGIPSRRPAIEMVIPSSLDPTLAPPGAHVALLFVQYLPYAVCKNWTDAEVDAFTQKVFDNVEEYAPGFKSTIIGYETLTPAKLEETFSLTGGNIFHGGLGWDQLFFARPFPSMPGYRTHVPGLYLCGSGCHPGGGVTGAPGRLAALTALGDLS